MRQACAHIAALLLMLCLPLAGAAQESGQGRLFVESNVDTPSISILNQELTFIQGMPLPPGMYVVQVAAEGYTPKTKTVNVLAGKDVRLRVNLEKAQQPQEAAAAPSATTPFQEERSKGKNRLYVKPTPTDATVRILNIAPKFEQGITLKPGTYEVEITKKGVGKMVRKVELRKNQDLTLHVNLEALQNDNENEDSQDSQNNEDETAESTEPGRLFVKTAPKDASVRLLGIEPVFKQGIRLDPGEYRIEVSREGYQKTVLEAEVFPGKDTRVSISLVSDTPVPEDFPPKELADAKTVTSPAGKAKEKLYVVTVPPEAGVRILNIVPKFQQGIEVGDGKFEVEVSHPDYETQVRMVDVPKNKHLAVGFDLRPEQERLRDSAKSPESSPQTPEVSDPSKGQLFVETDVDDPHIELMDLKQSFAQGMELPPGSYRIKVSREGVGSKEAMAVVSSGKASHVTVMLQPVSLPEQDAAHEKIEERRKALLQEALQLQQAEDLEKALQVVTQALELDPLYDRAHALHGDILFDRGDYEKALAVLHEGLDWDAERTDIHNLMGFCYFKLGEHKKAIQNFEQVLRFNPGSAIDYANIATNYRELGDREKAVAYYRLALELDPDIGFARENLERLLGAE